MLEPKSYDMKVRSITRIEREKEDSEMVMYRLLARDKEGINEITVVSASPFEGISPKDGVIEVVLKTSQKPLSDFVEQKDDE